MADLAFARWYYPPGRPLDEGKIFDDVAKVPPGWSPDPSPPPAGEDPTPVASEEPAISLADYEAAVKTAADLHERLGAAEGEIADLKAQLAAASAKPKKGKAAASDAPADAPTEDGGEA
jgi:uncharacterized small protein (DUF1192 family)